MNKVSNASEISLDRLSGIAAISEVLKVGICGVTQGRGRKPVLAS
jgi:hypothetical protein